MSQFDSLLDFGESTPAETNGTTQESQAVDEFDPFGPSPTIETKGNVDGNLLVDFTADTEISNGTKQNGTSEPFELSFEVSTSNDEVAAEPSTDEADTSAMSSSNPLYDLTSDEQSSNPLYEFETHSETTVVKSSSSQEFNTADSSNPLYDLSNNGDMHVETTVTSPSSNPLYDLMSNGNSGFGEGVVTETVTQKDEDGDFLIETTTTTQHYEQSSDMSNSAGQEDLVQVETPRDIMDEFESREVMHDSGVNEEDAYVEMNRQQDTMDNLLGDYENTQIMADVIIPQETTPEQREPSPEPVREPSPEPVREPSPEPVREPSPEPVREPSPEPIREPTPEPVREPSPEPVREPSPEPVREPTPEPVREPSPEPVREPSPEPREEEDQVIKDGQVVNRGKEEKRYSDSFGDTVDSRVVREVTVQSMGGGSAQQNGYDKDEVHFTEMSSVRNAFESGGPQQTTTIQQSQEVSWDDQEEGIYENEPVKRSDVVRESDRDIGAELPEIGMAKNLRNRFAQIENETKDYKREITPPRQASGKVEFESEPAPHIQVFEGKSDAGIFESQPQVNPDVVRSGETINEPLPERGTAKNIASKFKQLESGGSSYTPSPGKREITPDRSAGKVEFVSEPKTTIERYEGKAEAGIFENQPQSYEGVVRSEEGVEEILPERGTAKNIAQRFKEMESSSSSSTPRSKREITPDRNTKGEYVSEPRAHIEIYEGKAEAGVFENRPEDRSDVVKSEQYIEETLPERGFARNVAAKFKEMESNAKSPPPTPGRVKEFTPPRETGVFESNPQVSPDVVSENQHIDEIIPEKGYAKNLVSRFKQIEEENSKVAISNRKNKEITPPRAEAGVFENEPKQFIADYNQKTDSGISENTPQVRSDVFKETDPAKYEEELPERGTAKNLVSQWKQRETQSGKQSPGSSGRVKEFTPPREEERIKTLRSASSPGQFESVQPGDLPGQYHQPAEPSTFESEPQHRADVFREADTDWTEGMPKENAAKRRIEKFKQIQAEANKETPKPVSRKEDGDRQSPESEVTQQEAATPKKKGGFFIPTTPADKCGACQKTVYAMEKFEMNKVIYHKNCFRCSHCKSKLTPKTFAVNNGIIYCTNHLMQLFKSKGNYDEGFGREQHKKKWQSEGAKDSEQEAS